MKLSNFALKETKGESPLNWEYIAEVDCTTGILFWKKTQRREIRRKYAGIWYFSDTGEFALDMVWQMARAWSAKTGQST